MKLATPLVSPEGKVNRLALFLLLKDELELETVDTKSNMIGAIIGCGNTQEVQVFVEYESGHQQIFIFELVLKEEYKLISANNLGDE